MRLGALSEIGTLKQREKHVMKFVVTGANGRLGRLVIADLLTRGVAPESIAAGVRDPRKAADLAEQGVEVRTVDYDRPETLKAAFQPGDRVLLIASNVLGQRAGHAIAAIDAAAEAGVDLLAFTGTLGAPDADFIIAEEHKAIEVHLMASGLPWVLLRNGFYTENYTENLASALESGVLVGNAGNGRIASAARVDYAAAAAVVLTGEGHEKRAYELSGDTAWTMAEYAALVSEISGLDIVYREIPAEEHQAILVAAGLPESFAEALVDADAAIGRNRLDYTGGDLSRLIGRPTTTLRESVQAALAG